MRITSELVHLIELAIEEYYLIQIDRGWRYQSVFINNRPNETDLDMWSWISMILEMNLNKEVIEYIPRSTFSRIFLRAELRFIVSKKRTQTPMSESEIRYRSHKMRKELDKTYRGNPPLFILVINQWLLFGQPIKSFLHTCSP